MNQFNELKIIQCNESKIVNVMNQKESKQLIKINQKIIPYSESM